MKITNKELILELETKLLYLSDYKYDIWRDSFENKLATIRDVQARYNKLKKAITLLKEALL